MAVLLLRAGRALRLALGGERLVGLLGRRQELGPGEAVGQRGDARCHLLADELGGVAHDDVDVVDLADSGVRVVQPDLAELHLDVLADLDRHLRRELLERSLVEHLEVVEMLALLADEEEPALRRLLELAQPRAAGARRRARRPSR